MTSPSTLTPRSLLVAAAIFLVLAVIQTWPLAINPGQLSRNDNTDTMLNEWAIAWIAHQIVRDPINLFDANIFHPHRYTLAYSEPLILPGLIGAPLRWLGASPALTYNLLLLIGFVVTGLAMYVVVATWTHDHLAALLAGSLLAFNSHTMTRLPHLQAIFVFGLPLSLWAFDQLLTSGRTRHAVWLSLGVLGCALTSGHLAMLVVFALGPALLVRPDVWWRVQRPDVLSRLVIAAVATFVIAVVLLWPYQVLGAQEDFRRPLEGLTSANPLSYLSTAAQIHYNWWSYRIFRVLTHHTLFPGVTALVLCAMAFRARAVGIPAARRMLVAIGLIGFIMSLGTSTPVYRWAYEIIPPLGGIRNTARFGFLVILAVAGLAGFGLAALRQRWPTRWMTMISLGAFATADLEAVHAPMPYVPYKGIPAIYQPIAADPEPVAVLELPIYDGSSIHNNARYMLAATSHWKSLINGYSGHRPTDFNKTAHQMMQFPANRTIEALRALGVRYVVLHIDEYKDRDLARQIVERIARQRAIELVGIDGWDRLYRIR